MPRKPSTVLVMRNYPPFSPRRWYAAEVADVNVGVRSVDFELLVVDSADQAGRKLAHSLPAILTPNSPLAAFLRDGFSIDLATDDSFDLITVRGRWLELRIVQADAAATSTIVLVRRAESPAPACSPQRSRPAGSKSPRTIGKDTPDGLE